MYLQVLCGCRGSAQGDRKGRPYYTPGAPKYFRPWFVVEPCKRPPLDNHPSRVLFCICSLDTRLLAIILDKGCIMPTKMKNLLGRVHK